MIFANSQGRQTTFWDFAAEGLNPGEVVLRLRHGGETRTVSRQDLERFYFQADLAGEYYFVPAWGVSFPCWLFDTKEQT